MTYTQLALLGVAGAVLVDTVLLPGRLPLDEVLFFLVTPTCAILAFEAVRAVKRWPVGDEPREPAGR